MRIRRVSVEVEPSYHFEGDVLRFVVWTDTERYKIEETACRSVMQSCFDYLIEAMVDKLRAELIQAEKAETSAAQVTPDTRIQHSS